MLACLFIKNDNNVSKIKTNMGIVELYFINIYLINIYFYIFIFISKIKFFIFKYFELFTT